MENSRKILGIKKIKEEIVEEMKVKWKEEGESVDSDFYENLDDVVSDFLEDYPDFFKGVRDSDKRPAILAEVLDEML